MTIKYWIIDNYEFAYHWDPIGSASLELELHSLHEYGLAKEFLMHGALEEEFTYSIGDMLWPLVYRDIKIEEGAYD